MTNILATLKSLEQLLHVIYESPSLSSSRALPLIEAEMEGLRQAIEYAESLQSKANQTTGERA
jgi:hypothetical protein